METVPLDILKMFWKQGALGPVFRFSVIIITSLIFLLMSHTAYETHKAKCNLDKPLPILHRYFQAGDLTIGGITSQITLLDDLINFNTQPYQSSTDDIL